MTVITVFDPPLCCTTGVCGPGIDPVLARFAGDLEWLKRQGIEIQRYNLAHEPEQFAGNSVICALLEQPDYNASLPAIVIDDQLISHGRYPTRQELASMAGLENSNSIALNAELIQPVNMKGCCNSEQSTNKSSKCC